MIKMCLNFFFVICVLFSCNKTKNNTKDSVKVVSTAKEIVCNDSLLMVRLLQKTLDIKNLQQYYPVDEVKNRGYLVLLMNEQVTQYYDLYKFDKKVLFLTKEEILKKQITAYLEFKKVSIDNNLASITLLYPTQGIKCDAFFEEKDCNWILKDNKIVER